MLTRTLLLSRRGGVHSTARVLSSTTVDSTNLLTFEALVGISESILMYLVHSKYGLGLDALEKDKSLSTGTRLRKATEILAQTQLHVIMPFGYNPDEKDMRRFAQESNQLFSTLNPSKDAEEIKDFQAVQRDIWGVLAKRAFGASELNWLETGVGRSLAMGIGAQLTNPMNISKAEAISSKKGVAPELKLDMINDDVIIHAYKSAMTNVGIPLSEPSFGMTYASIQVLMMSDPLVAQTMMSAMGGLISRVPLLRGEMQ